MPGLGPYPTSRLGGKRTNVRLIGSVSSRLLAYASLAGLALLGGLAFGRLELTVLAVPFLLAIVVGALLTSEHDVRVSMAVDRTRLLEGEQAIVDLTLWTLQRDPAPRVGSESIEVTLDLADNKALGWQINFFSFGAVYVVAVCFWLYFDSTRPIVQEEH